MIGTVSRFAMFAAYQLVVIVGLLLLPIALVTRRFGVTLPIRTLIETTEAAYERTTE